MKSYNVDFTNFPLQFHRIVEIWYEWQGLYLWSRGKSPGAARRFAPKWETDEQIFWGSRPPVMLDDATLSFDNAPGDLTYYVASEGGLFYMDVQERGSRQRFWMFRRLEDLEKYVLLTVSQNARPGSYLSSPESRWRQLGVHPDVILEQADVERFPGRVSITILGESVDRGWMGKSDAIPFSHAIMLSFEELDQYVRSGIPEDGFQVSVTGAGKS